MKINKVRLKDLGAYTGLILITLLILGCSTVTEKRAKFAREYLVSNSSTTPEIQTAINKGEVILGMCPEEAIAAVGKPYFYEATLDKKWPDQTNPITVILAQCKNPDSSKISLYFSERQLRNNKRYKVLFENGVSIDIQPVNTR